MSRSSNGTGHYIFNVGVVSSILPRDAKTGQHVPRLAMSICNAYAESSILLCSTIYGR